jgi:DNA-binding LacI/PurR family transcriptional regulator
MIGNTAANGKKKARLIDIAEQVGVSKAAVASVLTNPGKNNIKVSAQTSEAIRRVAQEMNYTPNISARTLAGGKSMVIGALIDSWAPRSIYRILSEIEDQAAAAGYRLMVGQSHNNVENIFQCYQNFIRHDIDGVICMAHEYPGNEDKLRDFFEKRRNLVFVEKPAFGSGSYVDIERENGVRQAVLHLAEEGCARIGLLFWGAPASYYSLRQRRDGYRQGMAEAGLPFDAEFETAMDWNIPEAALVAALQAYIEEKIIPNRLDAVITSNDVVAAHLLRELQRRGLRVPEDVALVGHDNDDFTRFSYPSLTTVEQKTREVGNAAFKMLWEQLNGQSGPERFRRISTELVIRESSMRLNKNK